MSRTSRFTVRHNAFSCDNAAEVAAIDEMWSAIDWDKQRRRVSVEGRVVEFVEVGAGPCIVLIHGQGGCWQWWLRLMPLLATGARVLAIDLAGFGGSQGAEGDVFEAQIETVIGVLDRCRIAKATLVGHSMGGLITLAAATAHPDRVEALALVDAGGGAISGARLEIILKTFAVTNVVLQWSWFTGLLVAVPPLRRLTFALAVVDRQVVTKKMAAQIIPRLGSSGFIATLRAAAQALESIAPERVHCPTVVLWGSRDRILPVSTGRNLAARIEHATFEQLEDVGHCPMLEAPHRLAAKLAAIGDTADAPIRQLRRETPLSDGSSARASTDGSRSRHDTLEGDVL